MLSQERNPVTSIEDFTSQYGLVQKIDAFGYLDYLKKNPDAPRKHGKVVLVTADTPLKASRSRFQGWRVGRRQGLPDPPGADRLGSVR